MNRMLPVWFITLIISTSLSGQNFTDLNFESAKIIPVSTNADGSVNIASTNALPGWSAFVGTNQLFEIAYNPSGAFYHPIALSGSNAAVIIGNFDVSIGYNVAISQTGLVPSGTESLLFDATSSSFLVSLGGQSLSFMAISNALNSYGYSYTIYGAGISAFARQVETSTFSAIDFFSS